MLTSKVLQSLDRIIDQATAELASKVRNYLKAGDWVSLVKMRVDPRDYSDAEAYYHDAQVLAFFSKNVDLPTGIDRKKAALDSWIEAEHRCALTNVELNRMEYGPCDPYHLRLRQFLAKVREYSSTFLGPLPNALYGAFGPGVTLCSRGKLSTVADKMSVRPTCTRSLLPYLQWWEQSAWFRARKSKGFGYVNGSLDVELVDSAVWSCVPKDATTDRSIEIGPSVNVYHQLGIGRLMKGRFKRFGWDLLNAAPLHRRVACASSISGRFATIDLKQASDSLARCLIQHALPSSWAMLLDDMRIKKVKLPDGRVMLLEKFSGMGNGFTFELESLVFMSVCCAVLESRDVLPLPGVNVFVFGDDMIVPTECASDVIKALSMLGLVTNDRKTFVSGPFRESCGGDYFNGVAVRPHYLRSSPSNPVDWICLANGIRRRTSLYRRRYDNFRHLWFVILDHIPYQIRVCRGPPEMGDIVITDDPSFWITRTRHCIRYIRVFRPVLLKKDQRSGGSYIGWNNFSPEVQLASRLLRKIGDRGLVPRNPSLGYKLGWVNYS